MSISAATVFAGPDDDTAARALRDEVKQSVDNYPGRDLAKHLLRRANLGTDYVGEEHGREPRRNP